MSSCRATNAKRINALEVRAAEAEEQARATAQKLYEERSEVSNLRGQLQLRDTLLRAADAATERQAELGATYLDRAERAERERDEERALKARYGVALAESEGRCARLREHLRDAEGGFRAALRMSERGAGGRVS